MGYHLTILRTKNAEPIPIAEHEFVNAAQHFPILVRTTEPTAFQINRGDELSAMIRLQNGVIWTKVPERDVLLLMLDLAKILNGRVRGSEGETFRTVDETYFHPDDAPDQASTLELVRRKRRGQTIWKIIRWLALIAAIGLTIANKLRD